MKEIQEQIKAASSSVDERDVLINRLMDAPRELVFQAWTDPAHLVEWYAPNGCNIDIKEFEFRTGGSFLHCIHTEGNHDCWCKGVFEEIVAPERLVYTLMVANEQGDLVKPADVGMDPEWPSETRLTVTFTEQDGKTLITLHQAVNEKLAKKTGAYPSWLQMLDKLDIELTAIIK
jgi:uncharacterized protein YndB with AHSA1/START domain